MFGGDPFGNPFQQMQRQMQEMDNMMNTMMGGMMGSIFGGHHMPQQLMIGNGGAGRHASDNMLMNSFGGFGGDLFGGLIQQMDNIQHQAMNEPNATVFSQSTMISFDGSGQPRVVQSSTRRAGDVTETRHSDQRGAEARMRIGHHIGDREHIIEKRRDKNGRVRQQQQFVNMDEDEAEDFNNEFKARASRHMFNGYGAGSSSRRAIQAGSSSATAPSLSKDKRRLDSGRGESSSSTPIITVPDDEEDEEVEYVSSNCVNGPVIREITDDHDDSTSDNNAKRRKGLFGKFL